MPRCALAAALRGLRPALGERPPCLVRGAPPVAAPRQGGGPPGRAAPRRFQPQLTEEENPDGHHHAQAGRPQRRSGREESPAGSRGRWASRTSSFDRLDEDDQRSCSGSPSGRARSTVPTFASRQGPPEVRETGREGGRADGDTSSGPARKRILIASSRGSRPRPETRNAVAQSEIDFFRLLAHHLRSGRSGRVTSPDLASLVAFQSGKVLGPGSASKAGRQPHSRLRQDVRLFGVDLDPDSRTADWRFLLGHLEKTKWLVVQRAGPEWRIRLGPTMLRALRRTGPGRGCRERRRLPRPGGGGMNARQRRRRARRPYAAVPATQQRVDAEYRLTHERPARTSGRGRRRASRAVRPRALRASRGGPGAAPGRRRRRRSEAQEAGVRAREGRRPRPNPSREVDGVFLTASGHQITIQKAAAAEVMKGFRRVELLARGRAAAARSQERRERLTPVEALPSLAAAAPPAPTRRGQRRGPRARSPRRSAPGFLP